MYLKLTYIVHTTRTDGIASTQRQKPESYQSLPVQLQELCTAVPSVEVHRNEGYPDEK